MNVNFKEINYTVIENGVIVTKTAKVYDNEYDQYQDEINSNKDYKISAEEAIAYLREVNELYELLAEAKDDLYYAAVNYSFPIILIKYLMNHYGVEA